MTVTTTASSKVLDGNGVTKSFPFNFKFLNDEDIVVFITDEDDVRTDLEQGTGDDQYSLAGAGTDSGVVTYPAGAGGSALPSTSSITIERNMPYTQTLDLTNQSGIFLQVIEDALDKMVMLTQQVFNKDTYNALVKNSLNTFFDAVGTRISNVGTPVAATDAVRLSDLSDLENRVLNDSAVDFLTWNITATGGTDYDIDGATSSVEEAYDVLVEKIRQIPNVDYTIDIGAVPPQINFTENVAEDDNIFIIARGYNNNTISGSAGSWDDLTDKPTEFPPEAHTHDYSGVFAPLSHTHAASAIPDASTSAKGVVQLSSSTSSSSTALAATASAVKAVKDLADTKKDNFNVTISTSAPSGTPANGDIWYEREA